MKAGMDKMQSSTSIAHGKSGGRVHGKSSEHKSASLLKGKSAGDKMDLSTSRLGTGDAPEMQSSSQSGKAHHSKGKSKDCKAIPPGLAKKKSEDLPDGNPWKAALAKKEESQSTSNGASASDGAAAQTQAADASSSATNASEEMMAQLIELLTALLSSLQPNAQTAAA